MPDRKQIEKDILDHFASRDLEAGRAFDITGFWRITIPKYDLRDAELEAAMHTLAADGYVEARDSRYYLTSKGVARCSTTS